MEKVKAVFQNVWPYQKDKMNLPVSNVETAIPFYETIMGFTLVSRKNSPYNTAVLSRDDIQMAIAENGGDPSQDGCFFEVDNVAIALEELKSNGVEKKPLISELKNMVTVPGRFFTLLLLMDCAIAWGKS